MKEKVFARGFKGFAPDMKCCGKQYAENTVFEEEKAEMCQRGMHFCEYPLDVLSYYPPVNNCEINTFAPVEALAECQKREDKSATTKIRIGAKIDPAGLAKAAVDFIMERVKKEKKATNTGNWSAATNTGNWSAASVSGKESFAITTGIGGKVKAAFGCFIACAEWQQDKDGKWKPVAFKAAKVDGEIIKADTWYTLKNGKFVEAEN